MGMPAHPPDHDAPPFVRGMGVVRLAGVPGQREALRPPFTLVGIAGEDDLDAPDLAGQPGEDAKGGKRLPTAIPSDPLFGALDRRAGPDDGVRMDRVSKRSTRGRCGAVTANQFT
jgi:hypothetical protein